MPARWLLLVLAIALACAPLPGAAPPVSTSAARRAAALQVAWPAAGDAAWRIEDDPDRPLIASVYSFPSPLIAGGEARALLAAVRAADARRELLALVDLSMAQVLAPVAGPLRLRLLTARGGPYSPWPRDPFSFARARGGAVRIIVRPNLQRGREADAELGPELVQDLPADLDSAWGGVRWARAEVPFHNGQVLLTRQAAWVTLHTCEPRALALRGLARVPVETFGGAAGVDAYVAAVRRAADELTALYGRPVRFVHPLPDGGALMGEAARTELMRRLGGGAGYDLDSLVTLLPGRDGQGAALVADVALGERLLAQAPAAEWAAFAAGYGLSSAGGLTPALLAHARGEPSRELASFLDLVAAHLAAQGLAVGRLPLLLVPLDLLRDSQGLASGQFLIGWNNVVVETRGGTTRAEGFGSRLASGDRLAGEAFAAHGAHLELLPPLVGSVVRNGGYRCASNHLRAGAVR
ncbi:MAG TPA: hypothetical protein VGV61_09310 [Thermoanaerobaculia bacterium]|nr:hypothetical protein [Thermoanaerobaculia bacterium]